MGSIKSVARNALPTRWQVPIKYWYARMRGDLEPEMALLDRLVSRGEHVIDIGGNRGVYAYSFWKLRARLDVFEPNPDCAGILKSWAEDKQGVSVHPIALSSCAGTAQLHVPVDDQGVEHDASASIEASHAGQTRDLDVELRPLDSFGFTDVALIKIDVEGHESGVIEGALATLAASHPALIIEIEQRHNSRPIQEIFAQIEGLGYHGFFLKGGRLLPIAQFDPATDQSMSAFDSASADYLNNFIFLGREKLDRGGYRALLQSGGAGAQG
jgi:FkbM family methyltransferase